MTDSPNDPQHWLDRAEEARSLGEQMKDARAREHMFTAAAAYEVIAKLAEVGPLFRLGVVHGQEK